MSNISKLRDTADYLQNKKNFEGAYHIYDEINRQIWSALGSVQTGLTDFSRGYLTYNVMSGIEFRNYYTSRAATSVFIKWFNLDSDQVLNEFIFSVSGHLKCITRSKVIRENLSTLAVLSEFLTLYTLILYNADERWINQILKYSAPMVESNRLTKIRPNLQMPRLVNLLTQESPKLQNTDWSDLNFLMLEFLKHKGEHKSELFIAIKEITGERAKESANNYNTYEKYERYERYERYEKYEKYERKQDKKTSSSRSGKFNAKKATEAEKAKYYGTILGLEGVVTKKQIRAKYLKLIAQYHPDKVNSLGDELKTVAEEKSKEINEAYDWLKMKYKL